MRILIHLVRKELRDVRWLARGAALCVTAIAATLAWLIWKHRPQAAFSIAEGYVAGGTGLATAFCGAAVAAELFAGEAQSRRIDGVACLPVPLGRVFAAKTVAVLVTCFVFAAWAAASACASALFFWGPGPAADAISALPDAVSAAVGALTLVSAVALFAVLLEHGLGAVLGGAIATWFAAFQLHRSTPWDEWGVMPLPETLAGMSVVCSALLLTAAGFAFVRGPIHLNRRVRRVALGLGIACATLGVGGAATAAVLDARVDVPPGDPDAMVCEMRVSPDAKHAVVFVGCFRSAVTRHAWAVRLSDGHAVAVPGHYRRFRAWGDAGQARLFAGTRGHGSGVYDLVDTVDLETGAVLATRSQEQVDSEPWTEGWARLQRYPTGFVVEWPERGIKRRLEEAWMVEISPRPGRFLVGFNSRRPKTVVDLDTGTERVADIAATQGTFRWLDGGRVLRAVYAPEVQELDCETGERRSFTAPGGTWWQLAASPYATIQVAGGGIAVAHVREHVVAAGPWPSKLVALVTGSTKHALAMQTDGDARLVDLETAREVALGHIANINCDLQDLVQRLPDGTFLVARPAAGLDVVDAEGRVLRTLLKARE